MGYANIELIEQYNLSIIKGAIENTWYVISPFIDKDTPRVSASNPVLRLAIAEVITKM